jgi:sugar/nucleoside kinase (ribokinase family)
MSDRKDGFAMHFPIKVVSGREFDVVGFGTNAVDFLIEVPQYPAFNTKTELTNYTQSAGGEVATTMVGLQRLGLRTAYAGRFGSDRAGEFGLGSLTAEGVDTSYSQVIAGAETQIAFIVIDARNGERTVIWKRDRRLFYDDQDAPTEIVSRAAVLHLTPHDLQASIVMAKAAKQVGTIVSIDVDRASAGIDQLLPLVDIMVASAEFPQQLVGIDNHRDALVEIASRYGCAVTGVTLGESGSLLYCDGETISTPAFKVPGGCRDTTGAGDSFRVGIIYGLLKGCSIERSAKMANATAALKCRAVGARTSLPNEAELLDFLQSASA